MLTPQPRPMGTTGDEGSIGGTGEGSRQSISAVDILSPESMPFGDIGLSPYPVIMGRVVPISSIYQWPTSVVDPFDPYNPQWQAYWRGMGRRW